CGSGRTIALAYDEYGWDTGVVPIGNIGYVVETKMTTFNKLLCNTGDTTCTDTGAFSPATVNPVLENVDILIELPRPRVTFPGGCIPGTAPPANSPNGVCTLPLIVYHHGLGNSRGDMLAV